MLTLKSSLAGMLLAAVLVTGITAATSADSSPGKKNETSYSTPGTADESTQMDQQYKLTLQWAEAWKSRDGNLRLEIMSSPMQSEFREQQKAATGDASNTVIRWSSPWVVSYTAEVDGENTLITYRYKDSTGNQYLGTERLSFGKENGRIVVTSCRMESELEQYPEG